MRNHLIITTALFAFVATHGFSPSFVVTTTRSDTRLPAVKSKKNKNNKGAPSGGFGATKKATRVNFDAQASLLKSEKLYEEVRFARFAKTCERM